MAEASILSLKPKLKDINKYRELDDEFYSFGIELEVDDKELDNLEEKYSDPHKRLIKMFGVWLEKGENPTYTKLIKALVNIDKKDIAQSLCTDLELTSSLDSLLSTTSQAKLSECSPIPVKETDAHTDTETPVNDQSPQKTTASEHVQIKSPVASHTGDQPIPLPDSSHQKQVKDDSAYTSDTTDHSDDKSEQSHADSSLQTSIAHDTNVQAKSSSDTNDLILALSDSSHQECSTKDQTVVVSDSGQTASIDISTVSSTANDPHQVMLRCNDKLITALSADPQGIAGVLLAKGLIPENTEAQVQQCSTPREKATILVTTVRQRVEIAPKRFQEFLDILSKQEWTKDIMKVLQSCISPKQLRKDAGVQAVSTGDHDSTDKELKSSSDISSNGEDHTFPELSSQDKAELEAQLKKTKFDEIPTLDKLLILKYMDKGKKEMVRIISEASHKWKNIANLICDDANKTTVLEKKCCGDPEECIQQALVDNFINKKPMNYSQDWSGLIELLDDVGLETLAENVKYALLC